MGLVLLRLEGALVMVEPPGQARIGRVAEVDHGVLFAREGFLAEQLSGAVGQPAQADLLERKSGADLLAVEAREGGSGRDAVEAMVVIADLQNGLFHPASVSHWLPAASAPGPGA